MCFHLDGFSFCLLFLVLLFPPLWFPTELRPDVCQHQETLTDPLALSLSLDINARRKVGHQGQSLVTFCDFACCSHAGSISDLSLSLSLSVSVLKILTFKAKCLCIPLQISETLCAACLFPTLIITKWGFLAQFLFGLFSPAGLLIYLSIYPHFLVLKWQVKNIKWKPYTH